MNKLNKLAELLLEYPEEHSMLKELSKKYAGTIPYSDEAGAKGLSTTEQLGYAFHRGISGATQSGARGAATGKVDVIPTAKEVLVNAWNSKITDYTITALGAIGENIPVAGSAISIGASKILLVKSAAKPDLLSMAISVLCYIPQIGSKMSILAGAVKNNMSLLARAEYEAIGPIIGLVKAVLAAIAKMGDRTIKKTIEWMIRNTLPAYNYSQEKINQLVDGTIKAYDRFIVELAAINVASSQLA